VKGWLARLVLSIAGAVAGALLLGGLEAIKASNEWHAPFVATALGAVGVLVPVATFVGAGVAALALTIDPSRRWTFAQFWSSPDALSDGARSQLSAAALLAPGAALGWMVASAQAARAILLRQGEAWSAGAAMAAMSVLALAMSAAGVLALVPATSRVLPPRVGPFGAGGCGLLVALAGIGAGLALGDASGQGRTPLAILGVLARRELDLSPLLGLCVVAAGAVVGERVSREHRWGRVLAAAGVVASGWALVVHEGYALAEDPGIAYAIEHGAPLGRVGLALARRATDRDHDGSSYLFGGGDCDDSDPRRSPRAVDIPGNGIDEDCSGADLPLPRPVQPAPSATVRPAMPRDLSLVLVTVDTLRIDLGFMGYPRPVSPNLDALAARSTVFERAYSMASYTGKSVGPTMIGKYPSETLRDGAHFDTYFDDNLFLAERLRNAGFHTMGAASHWYFKPKYGLTQGMDIWNMSAMPPESAGDADSSVTSEALTDVAISMLKDWGGGPRRFFLWVHYFDPHANYVSHPEAPDFRAGARGWAKPSYDGEVWYTDHHIGRLIDFIGSQPWGKRTAIVITSDHGEAFEEHGMNYHGVDLWEPIVRVPLIVYVPGARPHRVAQKRSLIDLVPTVLDLMGLPPPPPGELSGESNAAAIVSPEDVAIDERDVFLDMPAGPEVTQHRAIIHGATPGMKLMSEGGPVYLLYDLSRDEAEADDLSRRDRATFGRMFDVFQEKLASLREIHVDPAPYKAR
jgi:arylsulfatase A-like enzyme